MAAYCKPCQAFHDIDAPHTRPQPLPKTSPVKLTPEDVGCAKCARWEARVKLLEERNERAAKILRGEP